MSSPVTNTPPLHVSQFPTFPSLRSSEPRFPRYVPGDRSSALTGGFTTLQDGNWDNDDDDEYKDLEYIEIPADPPAPPPPPPPPAAAAATSGSRKRATATPKGAAAARKRGRIATKPLSKRIKNEPSEDDDDDDDDDDIYRSEDPEERLHKPARWTKQELDLMHELCREGKTGREIWEELRSKLGCTKSRSSVDFCRHRIKVSQVKWSDEDVEHLLQAVKGFDKYKAIACEFNKLAGRPEKGEPFGKGIIEFKMKSLEMEAKKSLKK